MAKKTVNIGTSANKGNGDPLRTAFGKINDNFDELYSALGSDGDLFDPNSVDQSLVPTTTNTVDLGSASKQWRSLYVSNNTIYIGGTAVGLDANGNLTTGGTVVGSTPAWANITGKPTFATVATSGAYGDLSGRPTIPTLTSQLTNDSNFITTAVLNNGLNVDIKGSVFADDSTLMVDAVNNKIYATELTVAVGNFVNVNSNNVDVENINGLASQINFTVGGYNNLVIENNLVTIQNVSLSVAGDITLGGNIRSEGAINIDVNLTDSTLRRWRFGEDGKLDLAGNLKFADGTNQSTAWLGYTTTVETTHTVNLASATSSSGDGSVITLADNTATTKILLNNSLGVLGRATLPTLTTWGKIVIMYSQSSFATDVDLRLSDNSYANLTTVIPTTSSFGFNPVAGMRIAVSMAQFGWKLI